MFPFARKFATFIPALLLAVCAFVWITDSWNDWRHFDNVCAVTAVAEDVEEDEWEPDCWNDGVDACFGMQVPVAFGSCFRASVLTSSAHRSDKQERGLVSRYAPRKAIGAVRRLPHGNTGYKPSWLIPFFDGNNLRNQQNKQTKQVVIKWISLQFFWHY